MIIGIFIFILAVIIVADFVIAFIEIEMFLAPKSKLSKLVNFSAMPKNMTENEKLCNDMHDKLIKQGEEWYALHEKEHNTEELYLTSYDGLKLYARCVLQPKESHKWVIFAHGFHAPQNEQFEYGMYYYAQDYNVLMPTDRAHGKSGGRYIGMGWLDRKDYLDWIKIIIERDKDAQIVLHGTSMGGATVMMITGEETLPRNVFCCIEDCGYTSVWDEFCIQVKNLTHLNSFPLIPTASLICKIICGYSFKEASSLEQIKKSITPTLFIHGEDDKFVPPSMLDEVYQAASTPRKELESLPREKLTVPGAGHSMSRCMAPDLYWNTVFAFIQKYSKA